MSNFLSDDSVLKTNLRFNFTLNEGYGDDNSELKFDLYLMTREIKQITDSLRRITLLTRKEQRLWVEENQEMLNSFMDSLTRDMLDNLDDLEIDQDALQETMSCVSELRELANTLNSLMKGPRQLRS